MRLAGALMLMALGLLAWMTAEAKTMQTPESLRPPEAQGKWLRPSATHPAEPTVGFTSGIRLSLWPTPGPRGVIRVYAPHVVPTETHPTINFIAIEPVVNDVRGYSELELSSLDGVQGLRMWFSDQPTPSEAERMPWKPPRGTLGSIRADGKDVQTLTVWLNVERFASGAHPYVKVTFRDDRPLEAGFEVFSASGGKTMQSCVLTATMGNYSRTRLLWLKDETLDSRQLWPEFDGPDFVWTDEIPSSRLLRAEDGTIMVAITPNEPNLSTAEMPPGGWPFPGKVSTQYWRKYPGTADSNLRVRVNGRAQYWGSKAKIPGGVAFENFELIEPFKPGLESWFGVTLETPNQLGWRP